MDVVLFRKLTRKSILKFGEYKDVSVQQIINLGRMPYLRWIYYNIATITFTDDVLEDIFIHEEDRIPKPGTSSELHHIINKRYADKMGLYLTKSVESKRKRRKLQKLIQTNYSVNFSKRQLQAINQGK